MSKILFICTEGFDTPGPSNHLISSLIEDTLDSGMKVDLIQSRRKKLNAEIPNNLKNKEGFNVRTVDRRIIEKSNFVSRYVEEALYSFRCFNIWRKIEGVDVVFVQSCPTVLFSIILLKLCMKKPVLYSVQDMWPGSAVNSGVLKSRIIASLFYSMQKLAYKLSDKLTVISNDMKFKLLEEGVREEKIETIVNWFDDKTVKEVEWKNNKFVDKYNLSKDKFYVQYAGTMGYVFDYNMVLEVAELLKDYTNIEFQMIGQGSQKEMFMQEKEKRKLDNIVFYPLEPQNMVSDVYSTCSVCLIPLKKGIIGNSVPSKAGLLMACNRAIINSVDKSSDYYRLFNENKIGISVPNEDPYQVANSILKLYNDKELCDELAKNGHDFGQKYYARSNNTIKFIEIFKSLAKYERK